MTIAIIIVSVLLILAFLATLRFKMTIILQDELQVYVKTLFFVKIPLFPGKPERIKASAYSSRRLKKREKRSQRKAAQPDKAKKNPSEASRKKQSLSEKITLIVDLVKIFAGRFFRHLRVELAHIHVTVATGDAANTAMLYGAVSQSVAYLLAFLNTLDRVTTPDLSDVSVSPDWIGERTKADIKIELSLRLWHFFDILNHLIPGFFRHIRKKASPQRTPAKTSSPPTTH